MAKKFSANLCQFILGFAFHGYKEYVDWLGFGSVVSRDIGSKTWEYVPGMRSVLWGEIKDMSTTVAHWKNILSKTRTSNSPWLVWTRGVSREKKRLLPYLLCICVSSHFPQQSHHNNNTLGRSKLVLFCHCIRFPHIQWIQVHVSKERGRARHRGGSNPGPSGCREGPLYCHDNILIRFDYYFPPIHPCSFCN